MNVQYSRRQIKNYRHKRKKRIELRRLKRIEIIKRIFKL